MKRAATTTTAAAKRTRTLGATCRLQPSTDPPVRTLILGTHPSVKSFAEAPLAAK